MPSYYWTASALLPLARQHVAALIKKAPFCMQIPAPPFPSPHLSTPLQFSIKIQTEIDDLKGSHCCLPDRDRHLKGRGGRGLLSDRELVSPSPHCDIIHLIEALSSQLSQVLISAAVDLSLELK